MDIEKLIEQLRKSADFEDYPIVASFAAIIEKKYLRETADALEKLQAENEKLREKIEDARLEGYAKGLSEMSEENEKLQAELEQMKVERDAAVALVHEWEEYGRYLSPMGFTVPHNWRND